MPLTCAGVALCCAPRGIQGRQDRERERGDRHGDDVEELHFRRQLRHVIDVARHDLETERLLEPRHDDADVVSKQ